MREIYLAAIDVENKFVRRHKGNVNKSFDVRIFERNILRRV